MMNKEELNMEELRKNLESVIKFQENNIDLVEECLIKEVSGENNTDKKKCLSEMRNLSIKLIDIHKNQLEFLEQLNEGINEQLNEAIEDMKEIIKKEEEQCMQLANRLLCDLYGQE